MTNYCVYVKNSDGVKILCQVLETGIYNPYSLLPSMVVKSMRSNERLNPINRVMVPQMGLFTEKEKESS